MDGNACRLRNGTLGGQDNTPLVDIEGSQISPQWQAVILEDSKHFSEAETVVYLEGDDRANRVQPQQIRSYVELKKVSYCYRCLHSSR